MESRTVKSGDTEEKIPFHKTCKFKLYLISALVLVVLGALAAVGAVIVNKNGGGSSGGGDGGGANDAAATGGGDGGEADVAAGDDLGDMLSNETEGWNWTAVPTLSPTAAAP